MSLSASMSTTMMLVVVIVLFVIQAAGLEDIAEAFPTDSDHTQELQQQQQQQQRQQPLTPPIATAHTCIHDSRELQQGLHHSGMDIVVPVAYDPVLPGRQGTARATIRVRVVTTDLDDATKFCTAAGQTRPDFKGATVTCVAEDIFTDEKRAILVTRIIPNAIARLQKHLKVTRTSGSIVVPQGACVAHAIPPGHSSGGVAGADFVLYVAAAPTGTSTVAWAGRCTVDQMGRPVSGRATFGPRFIGWSETDGGADAEGQIDTAVHELLHALGFSSGSFPSGKVTSVSNVRGKPEAVTALTSTEVVAKAREHLGCPTLTHVELEDGGGSGSVGSHWEKRIFRDEIMAAAAGRAVSVMTLALLKDLGHYDVDYSLAEPMPFSANAGCSYVSEKCNTVGGGNGKQFCFAINSTDASYQQCVDDDTAIGYCATRSWTSLPAHFSYFPSNALIGGTSDFTDYCPSYVAFSNRRCGVTAETTGSDATFAHYFGVGGRCFKTVGTYGLIKAGFTASPTTSKFRCLQARCVLGLIEFKVGNSAYVPCPTNGSAGNVNAPAGYSGQIACPLAAAFCASTPAPETPLPPGPPPTTVPLPPGPPPPVGPGNTPSTGPSTGPSPPPPPPPSPAPPTTPIPDAVPSLPVASAEFPHVLLKARVRLGGDSFGTLLAQDNLRTALANAVRSDLARLLRLPPVRVRIDGLALGSLIVDFAFLTNGTEALLLEERAAAAATVRAAVASAGWLTSTNGVYATASSSQATVTVQSFDFESGSTKSGGAWGASISSALCALLLVVFVVAGC